MRRWRDQFLIDVRASLQGTRNTSTSTYYKSLPLSAPGWWSRLKPIAKWYWKGAWELIEKNEIKTRYGLVYSPHPESCLVKLSNFVWTKKEGIISATNKRLSSILHARPCGCICGHNVITNELYGEKSQKLNGSNCFIACLNSPSTLWYANTDDQRESCAAWPEN